MASFEGGRAKPCASSTLTTEWRAALAEKDGKPRAPCGGRGCAPGGLTAAEVPFSCDSDHASHSTTCTTVGDETGAGGFIGPSPVPAPHAGGLSENMSALRHADLRRGRLRRNGMAASCGRPRASATQACVDFPATVPQAAWRRALDDPFACTPPWRLGRTSPRRPHQPPLRRARQAPTGHADVPLVVTFVEVPEASGPPVAPPACVRGSTAGEIFSPPTQGGPPPDGQGRRAPEKRKSRPDACRRGRLSDRLEVIE